MERRAHFRGRPRTGRRVAIRYAPAGSPPSSAVSAFTHDIGVGGAFIETDEPVPVGSALALVIDVPGPTGAIELRGEVRWVADAAQLPAGRRPGMGVKFGALDVDALLALSDYFAELAGSGPAGGEARET